ncbi:MAG TPA: uroporphyrinogen-III synthase [Acidimicrobiales bacterium]
MHVVLTREHGHNEKLKAWLPDDAVVNEVPLTHTHYFDVNEVRATIMASDFAGRFKALVVTSARSARYVAAAKDALAEGALVLSVGAATTRALDGETTDVDVEGEGGALELAAEIFDGPVLLLGASTMRRELPTILRARGLEVTKLACYETLPTTLSAADEVLLRRADVVLIGAPSAWHVAEGFIDPRTWVIVPGATTGDEVRRFHEHVFVGWGPDLLEHLRAL